MRIKTTKKIFASSKGFTLLEVLMGVTVFMIGMLGVTALNISALKSNTFAGNMSEATFLGSSRLEALMGMDYDDLDAGADGIGGSQAGTQDDDDDGLDDDDPEDTDAPAVDGIPNFGLDNNTTATADGFDEDIGKNSIYSVYWNIAEDEPMADAKTIKVIVQWRMKDEVRQIDFSVVRLSD